MLYAFYEIGVEASVVSVNVSLYKLWSSKKECGNNWGSNFKTQNREKSLETFLSKTIMHDNLTLMWNEHQVV